MWFLSKTKFCATTNWPNKWWAVRVMPISVWFRVKKKVGEMGKKERKKENKSNGEIEQKCSKIVYILWVQESSQRTLMKWKETPIFDTEISKTVKTWYEMLVLKINFELATNSSQQFKLSSIYWTTT